MTRIEQIWHERLEAWARWRISSGVSGGISCAYRDEWWLFPPQVPMPLVGEALDTDDLVVRLPQHERDTVVEEYCRLIHPPTQEARARVLRIHVNTYRERLRQAKFRLEDMHQTRKAALQRAVARTHSPIPLAA